MTPDDNMQLTLLIKSFDNLQPKKRMQHTLIASNLTFSIADLRLEADRGGGIESDLLHAFINAVEGSDAERWRQLAEKQQKRIDELVAALLQARSFVKAVLKLKPESDQAAIKKLLGETITELDPR